MQEQRRLSPIFGPCYFESTGSGLYDWFTHSHRVIPSSCSRDFQQHVNAGPGLHLQIPPFTKIAQTCKALPSNSALPISHYFLELRVQNKPELDALLRLDAESLPTSGNCRHAKTYSEVARMLSVGARASSNAEATQIPHVESMIAVARIIGRNPSNHQADQATETSSRTQVQTGNSILPVGIPQKRGGHSARHHAKELRATWYHRVRKRRSIIGGQATYIVVYAG